MTHQQKKAALEEIEARHGSLTASLVVEEARNPRHVLHTQFDWDDKRAASKHRLDTARALIASVRVIVVIEDRNISVVGFVHNPASVGQGYIALSSLAQNRENAQSAILVELERIIGAIQRARSIAEGLGLSEFLETALQATLKARTKITRKRKVA
jgi:hypothetical protein